VRINQLATAPNLQLAWRRITTGGNHQYKRFFRKLYLAYEMSLADNLEDLGAARKATTFKGISSLKLNRDPLGSHFSSNDCASFAER
jgi:hypothetical protein